MAQTKIEGFFICNEIDHEGKRFGTWRWKQNM